MSSNKGISNLYFGAETDSFASTTFERIAARCWLNGVCDDCVVINPKNKSDVTLPFLDAEKYYYMRCFVLKDRAIQKFKIKLCNTIPASQNSDDTKRILNPSNTNTQLIKNVVVPGLANDNIYADNAFYGTDLNRTDETFNLALSNNIVDDNNSLQLDNILFNNLGVFLRTLYGSTQGNNKINTLKTELLEDLNNGILNLDLLSLNIENSIAAVKDQLEKYSIQDLALETIEFVFKPDKNNFNTILFELDRSFELVPRYPIIGYAEIKELKNLLQHRNIFSLTVLPSSSNDLLMCINGQEFHTGNTNQFKITQDDLKINFFSTPKAMIMRDFTANEQNALKEYIKQFKSYSNDKKRDNMISFIIEDSRFSNNRQDEFTLQYSFIKEGDEE